MWTSSRTNFHHRAVPASSSRQDGSSTRVGGTGLYRSAVAGKLPPGRFRYVIRRCFPEWERKVRFSVSEAQAVIDAHRQLGP